MSYQESIRRELRLAREALKSGNDGMARTCARRAIGIAATELMRLDPGFALGQDFISQIRSIAAHQAFNNDVRSAAHRLQARIGKDFTSPSQDPVQDAERVLHDLVQRIQRLQERSSER